MMCASRETAIDHVTSCFPNLIPDVETAFNFTHLLWHLGAGSGLHFLHTYLPSDQPSFHPDIHSLLSEWTVGGVNGGGRIRSRELSFTYPSPNKPNFLTREELRVVSTLVCSRKTSMRCSGGQIDQLLHLLNDATETSSNEPLGALSVVAVGFTMDNLCRVITSLCTWQTNSPWRLLPGGLQLSFLTGAPTTPPNASCPLSALAEPGEHVSGRVGRLVFRNPHVGLRFVARVDRFQSYSTVNAHSEGISRVRLTFEH